MSKLYLGSIDLTKIDKADIQTTGKDGMPFKNGAKYLSVAIWVNDEPDKYGNHIGIKAGATGSTYYIGNAKEYQQKPEPQTQQPQPSLGAPDSDDLPF